MAIRPVLEIFKMAGYFPDSPRMKQKKVKTKKPNKIKNKIGGKEELGANTEMTQSGKGLH
jgi:hypothetical protein